MAIAWSALTKWVDETWSTILREKSDELNLGEYAKSDKPDYERVPFPEVPQWGSIWHGTPKTAEEWIDEARKR